MVVIPSYTSKINKTSYNPSFQGLCKSRRTLHHWETITCYTQGFPLILLKAFFKDKASFQWYKFLIAILHLNNILTLFCADTFKNRLNWRYMRFDGLKGISLYSLASFSWTFCFPFPIFLLSATCSYTKGF